MPILLTLVPPLRRHLLRRYRRHLSKTIKDSAASYVPPDARWDAKSFSKQIVKQRCMFIMGDSGLGKSAFLSYFAHFAANAPWRAGKIDLPVLIRLREHADDAPESVFFSALKALGQFNDDNLQDELLRNGRVLFLVDGLNEVPEATRQRWSAFRRAHAFNHLFVFTSQAHESEFHDLPPSPLAHLPEAQARTLLERDFKIPQALLNALPPHAFEFARNPQNLRTLGGLLAAGKPVPQNLYGLYFEVLNPIHEAWKAKGQENYGEQLAQAALKHLQEARVDLVTALSPSALDDLRKERLVVSRAGKPEFAHDRLASFLAASYLNREPDAVSQLVISKATNWKFVVDLLVEHTSVATARTLAFGLLDNTSAGALKLAEEFVFALHEKRGAALSEWLNEFDRLLTVRRRERHTPKAA